MGKIEGVNFKCGLFDLVKLLDVSKKTTLVSCTFMGLGESSRSSSLELEPIIVK